MRSGEAVDDQWRDPRGIPPGFSRGPRELAPGDWDPRYIQANLFTLAQIGGIYDLIALQVEQDHIELLTRWRLVSQAPSVLEYMRERSNRIAQRQEIPQNAKSRDQAPTD